MSLYDQKNPFLRSVQYRSGRPGPKLLITGSVHGDEVCGPRAIADIERQFTEGALRLKRGQVTLIPVVNAKAHVQGTRDGDRNFNRDLKIRSVCGDYEDHIGNALSPIMAAHDALLDVHSFPDPGRPFVFVGPENNSGDLQPFTRAGEERAFALSLGLDLIFTGWLESFSSAVDKITQLTSSSGAGPSVQVTRGVGTTEFMRQLGGYGVTLECGQHKDPANDDVARRAILGALQHLDLIEAVETFAPVAPRVIRLVDAVIRRSAGDQWAKPWKHLDTMVKGEPIATLDGAGEITAPFDGVIVLPFVDAAPYTEWMYFATEEASL